MEPLLSDFYRTGIHTDTPKMSISMAATLVLALLPLPTADAMITGSRTNCSASCGPNYELSYPFGIGNECSLPGFNLTCVQGAHNTTTLLLGNPAMVIDGTANNGFNSPYSAIGDTTSPAGFNSPYSSTSDRTPYPAIGASISYFFNMTPGVRDYTVHWEAPGRPFAISGSSYMSLFVVGCGVKASLLTGDDSGDEVGSCSVICAGDQFMVLSDNEPCVGIGCCRIDITVNLRAFTLNISRISGAARVLEQVKAFITDRANYGFRGWDLGHDLTGQYNASLSWAIPFQPDCKHAMEDRASYACYNNSKCQDSPIGGYVCNCTGGFSGDPYVVNGCVVQGQLSLLFLHNYIYLRNS